MIGWLKCEVNEPIFWHLVYVYVYENSQGVVF